MNVYLDKFLVYMRFLRELTGDRYELVIKPDGSGYLGDRADDTKHFEFSDIKDLEKAFHGKVLDILSCNHGLR